MKKSTFVIDIDGTICRAEFLDGRFDYANAFPIQPVIQRIRDLKDAGHDIVLFTARGMRTYGGDVEMIEVNVRPVLTEWLDRHKVPYDRLIMGKPWGPNVFYIDDRALNPTEFAHTSPEEYETLVNSTTL